TELPNSEAIQRRQTGSASSARRSSFRLNQPQLLQALVSVAPDDDVVMHRDPERSRDLRDLPRHLDVGARWRRIAGRMVVHQNDGRAMILISPEFLMWRTTTGGVDWGREGLRIRDPPAALVFLPRPPLCS